MGRDTNEAKERGAGPKKKLDAPLPVAAPGATLTPEPIKQAQPKPAQDAPRGVQVELSRMMVEEFAALTGESSSQPMNCLRGALVLLRNAARRERWEDSAYGPKE